MGNRNRISEIEKDEMIREFTKVQCSKLYVTEQLRYQVTALLRVLSGASTEQDSPLRILDLDGAPHSFWIVHV